MLIQSVCSLRQHDLDQVIRVERGSLLSVLHRRTPRSIVGYKYTLNFQAVNSKNEVARYIVPVQVNARVDAIPPSSAIRVG